MEACDTVQSITHQKCQSLARGSAIEGLQNYLQVSGWAECDCACWHTTCPPLYRCKQTKLLRVDAPVATQERLAGSQPCSWNDHSMVLCGLAHGMTVVRCFAGRTTDRAADAVDPFPRAWPTAEVTPHTSPVPTAAPEGNPQSAAPGKVGFSAPSMLLPLVWAAITLL